MAIYNNFNELNGKTLAYHDIVMLFNQPHTVMHRFLTNDTGANNAYVIRKFLGYDVEQFLSTCYGYDTLGGDWAECKTDDYEALTRACLVIMGLSEKCAVTIEVNGEEHTFSPTSKTGTINRYSSVRVGDYTGTFESSHFKVGCQEIPYSTIKQIYQAAKKFKLITSIALILTLSLSSCARSISVFDAANGRARCGMHLKG